MKRCLECDEPVTKQFTRVFGDRDDEVRGCPRCSSYSFLAKGGAAGLSRPEWCE